MSAASASSRPRCMIAGSARRAFKPSAVASPALLVGGAVPPGSLGPTATSINNSGLAPWDDRSRSRPPARPESLDRGCSGRQILSGRLAEFGQEVHPALMGELHCLAKGAVWPQVGLDERVLQNSETRYQTLAITVEPRLCSTASGPRQGRILRPRPLRASTNAHLKVEREPSWVAMSSAMNSNPASAGSGEYSRRSDAPPRPVLVVDPRSMRHPPLVSTKRRRRVGTWSVGSARLVRAMGRHRTADAGSGSRAAIPDPRGEAS